MKWNVASSASSNSWVPLLFFAAASRRAMSQSIISDFLSAMVSESPTYQHFGRGVYLAKELWAWRINSELDIATPRSGGERSLVKSRKVLNFGPMSMDGQFITIFISARLAHRFSVTYCQTNQSSQRDWYLKYKYKCRGVLFRLTWFANQTPSGQASSFWSSFASVFQRKRKISPWMWLEAHRKFKMQLS